MVLKSYRMAFCMISAYSEFLLKLNWNLTVTFLISSWSFLKDHQVFSKCLAFWKQKWIKIIFCSRMWPSCIILYDFCKASLSSCRILEVHWMLHVTFFAISGECTKQLKTFMDHSGTVQIISVTIPCYLIHSGVFPTGGLFCVIPVHFCIIHVYLRGSLNEIYKKSKFL